MSAARSTYRSWSLTMLIVLLMCFTCLPAATQPTAENGTYPPVSTAQKQCLVAALAPQDSESSPPVNDEPNSRVVNIGFEDVTSDDPTRIPEIAHELNSINVTGVSISVGRLDWIGFPWAKYSNQESEEVARTGRDYVSEAISALICSDSGQRRTITLSIDTLLGRDIELHPERAGINAQGTVSKNWGSVSAWKYTDLSTRLEQLTSELINRYSPNSINVTEMMFPSYTFSDADFQDFQAYSGMHQWPLTAEGAKDTDSELLHAWRSDAVSSIMAVVARQFEGTDVQLTMDVRSPFTTDSRGRPDSGQDYEQLLKIVDRLNIWNFQGVNSSGYYDTEQLSRLFVDAAPSRFGIELGLWEKYGRLSAETLERELRLAEEHKVQYVSITPTSLMDEQIWDTLRKIWGAPKDVN